MYEGDMSRKRNLVDFGFRLPSAMDNRPLKWDEFLERVGQTVYLSATPGKYELGKADGFVQQIIRPTGLVDPEVVVKPTKGQIDDLLGEIKTRVEKDERVLVTTLTKRMAEDLTDYLLGHGVKVEYLHSDVDTLRRVELLRELRMGVLDVPDPDHRPRRPQRVRPGAHVRGQDHRLHGPRHRRNEPAPRHPGGLQHGEGDRSAAAAEEDRGHHRPARQGRCGHPGAAGQRRQNARQGQGQLQGPVRRARGGPGGGPRWPDRTVDRADARRGRRAAVRAGGQAPGRGRRTQEGTA